MTIVSNASPLINLARIEQLRLLPTLYGKICIPDLDALRNQAGFRVRDTLYARVLRDAGEM